MRRAGTLTPIVARTKGIGRATAAAALPEGVAAALLGDAEPAFPTGATPDVDRGAPQAR